MLCTIQRLAMEERSLEEDAEIEGYPSGAASVNGSDTNNNHDFGAASINYFDNDNLHGAASINSNQQQYGYVSINNSQQQYGAASLNGHHHYGSGSANEQESDNNEPNTPNSNRETYPARMWNHLEPQWAMFTGDIGDNINQRLNTTNNNNAHEEAQRMQQFFENEIGNENTPGAENLLANSEGVDTIHPHKQFVCPLDIEPNNPFNYGHIQEVDGDNNDHFNFNFNNVNDGNIPYTGESEHANTQSPKRKRSEISTSTDTDDNEELTTQIRRRAFNHTTEIAEYIHALKQVLASKREEITELRKELAARDKKYDQGYLSREKCAYLYPKDRNHHDKYEQTYIRDSNPIVWALQDAIEESEDFQAAIKNAILSAAITDETIERFREEIQEEVSGLETDHAEPELEEYIATNYFEDEMVQLKGV